MKQSFQITPVQMATTVSSLINGGVRVTPHFGMGIVDREGESWSLFLSGKKRSGIERNVGDNANDP
ncbi:MAG: penicillin-binding transpeptidase domain-containing protein [Coprococcus sp.]